METFNLQFFATMTTGTSTLSPEMRTWYEKRLIDGAEPNLVHDQFGDTYNIPKHGGKTIQFRKFADLAVPTAALTEGVTPDPQSLTVTEVKATVGQWGAYTTIADMLEMTAIDPILENATNVLGSQAGKKSDHITRDILAACTSVIFAPKSAGTAVTAAKDLDDTCLLTKDLIFKAVADLRTKNAQPFEDGMYVGIIHPQVACDLMSVGESGGWIDINKYKNPENIYRGEVGSLGGVRFVMSSEAKCEGVPANGTVSCFDTLILGQHAYAVTSVEGGGLEMIIKQLGSGGTSDPLNQRSTAGWKLTKTAEILDHTKMVVIKHACKANSTMAAN